MRILGCDITTEHSGVILSDARIVHHSTWIARALQRCVQSGRTFVLVTPPHSRLSLGLARVLELTQSQWVVSGDDGQPYNGFTGTVAVWDGDLYRDAQEISVAFQEGIRPSSGGVMITAESLRPARRTTSVGALTAACSRALTGGGPGGWGVLEPVTEPWSEHDITERYKKDRSARNTIHVASSVRKDRHMAALTQIERPNRGVVERVTAGFQTEQPWGGDETMAFADAMQKAGVRWAMAQHVLGFDPAYRVPFYTGVPVPCVAVFGPEALHGRGEETALEYARRDAGANAELMGDAGHRCLVITYHQEPSQTRAHPAVEYNNLASFLAGSQTRRDAPN